MSILPQSLSTSHSGFQPVLMLAAPQIAGLLPAHCSPASAAGHEAEARPPGPSEMTYDDPRLSHFLPWVYKAMFREVEHLLDQTVTLLTGESDRRRFASACDRFAGQMAMLYDQLIPPDQQPPVEPIKTNADFDRDIDYFHEQTRQEFIKLHERHERERAARRAERQAGM